MRAYQKKRMQRAVTEAVAKARCLGFAMVARRGDELVEIRPDGTLRPLKPLPPKIRVEKGSRLVIQ